MTEPERDTMARLALLVDELAQRIGSAGSVGDAEVAQLLDRAGLRSDESAAARLRRCSTLLQGLHRLVESARLVAVESLVLAGLPEETVCRAVAHLAGPGREDAGGRANAPGQGVQPVSCSIERLDLGVLAAGETGQASFELAGGPGTIEVASDYVRLVPRRFGPGPTRIEVAAQPQTDGVLLTTIRAVTADETLEVPVLARWQVGGPPAPVPARSGSTGRGAAREPQPAKGVPAASASAGKTVTVKTLLVVSRVIGFPRALALQRAIERIPGVVGARALGYDQDILSLQVQHDAMLNLAEVVTELPGFPLTIINSSLGRIHLVAEGR